MIFVFFVLHATAKAANVIDSPGRSRTARVSERPRPSDRAAPVLHIGNMRFFASAAAGHVLLISNAGGRAEPNRARKQAASTFRAGGAVPLRSRFGFVPLCRGNVTLREPK
jgi:hypothetical protein